ncbi:MAG: hypothetical protein HC830_09290 [Bacteroidetes bacterium]|nr:hypothetical protein [Bacteroidota bacterium]
MLNAPYYVDKGTQNVYSGEIHADVTIEAGVTMIFNTSTGLVVGNGTNGSLKAIGTQAKPIIFKGANPGNGSWVGLSFNTASVNNGLEYCTVDGGGASNPPYNDASEKGNIVLGSWYSATANLFLRNSTLKNSGCWGIFIDSNTSLNLGTGVTYQNNTCGNKNK